MQATYINTILLGTHDIITATASNGTRITTQYFENSTAFGALYVLVFITDEEEVDFVILAIDRETSRDYTLPFSLFSREYRVYVYDIEQDGTLPSGVSYPAVTLSSGGDYIAVTSEVQKGRIEKNFCADTSFFTFLGYNLQNCTINTFQHYIIVECVFSMATGFQVIAQLDVLDKVHKLYVNQTLPDQTSASVKVEESGEYLVSIFPIREGNGITSSISMEYSIVMLSTSFGEELWTF